MIKYFIEHNETHEWFMPSWVPKFTNTFNGSRIRNGSSFMPVWTRNPNLKEIAHDSIEEAQSTIDIYNVENVTITEHEFVNA